MPRADEDRDCSGAAASQGRPEITSHQQKLGWGKEGSLPFPYRVQGEHGPADTLSLDFWLLEM